MFNTKEWSKLTEDTYGYLSRVYRSEDFKIYYSYVNNEVGEYFVAPSFGDFISVDDSGFRTIEKWAAENPRVPIRLKVCCKVAPDVENFVIRPSGFIHEIEYDSYDDWYENSVQYRFKRNIKLARKKGVRVEIEKDRKSVRKFWEMHASLRLGKFNEIPQPWCYFENILNVFIKKNQGFILSAYNQEDSLIAGILVILHKDTAYYKFNASVLEQLSVRPNNLLIDRLVNYLSGLSIRKLNLGYTGSSSEYEGLRIFKLTAGGKGYNRYILETPSFDSLDRTIIININKEIQSLISANPSLDEIDQFSEGQYKYFI